MKTWQQNYLKLKIKKMEAEVIAHNDVKGRTLYYVKIKEGDKDYLINIGKNTYYSILKLKTNEQLTGTEPTENQNQQGIEKPSTDIPTNGNTERTPKTTTTKPK